MLKVVFCVKLLNFLAIIMYMANVSLGVRLPVNQLSGRGLVTSDVQAFIRWMQELVKG